MSYVVLHRQQMGSVTLNATKVDNLNIFMERLDDLLNKYDLDFKIELLLIGNLDVYREYAPFTLLNSMEEMIHVLYQWLNPENI